MSEKQKYWLLGFRKLYNEQVKFPQVVEATDGTDLDGFPLVMVTESSGVKEEWSLFWFNYEKLQ